LRDLDAAIGALRAAWMAGRPAADATPAEWRDVAGSGADSELALAAIAGQALEIAFRLRPGAPLEERPILPQLGLPTPPDEARRMARRLMASLRDEAEKARLIGLLLSRGRVMHPADWFPAPGDDWLPDIYGPWLDWLRGEAVPGESSLTEATWDAWPWSARRTELRRMRRSDPASAHALIAGRLPGEPVGRRVQILEMLAESLSRCVLHRSSRRTTT
jgi:hypothetical protein